MRQTGIADYNSSRNRKPIAMLGTTETRPTDIQQGPNQKADILDANLESNLPQQRAQDKASSSGTRPKEGASFVLYFCSKCFWYIYIYMCVCVCVF